MPLYQSSSPSSSKYTCGGCETSVLNWMTGRRKGYRFLLSAPRPCENTKIQDVNAKRKPDKECTLNTPPYVLQFNGFSLQITLAEWCGIETHWLIQNLTHPSPATVQLLVKDQTSVNQVNREEALCKHRMFLWLQNTCLRVQELFMDLFF